MIYVVYTYYDAYSKRDIFIKFCLGCKGWKRYDVPLRKTSDACIMNGKGGRRDNRAS